MADTAVRAARSGEADLLTALAFRSKAHWGYDEEFMDACREELRVDPVDIGAGLVLVVEVDGTIAGVAGLSGDIPDAELESMFVDPPSIRSGVGDALFRAICDLARARGFGRLLIESDPNATGFYERQGAVSIGDRESASVPGRRLPLLELDLS